MEKLRRYFEEIGFLGEYLDTMVDSFVLQPFEKNDFVEETARADYRSFIRMIAIF